MSDHGDEQFEMVMPFVNVTSVGGRFDDDAYCAGYEMGLLAARLQMAENIRADELDVPVRTDNVTQADHIAMRHGFVIADRIDHDDGWTDLTLATHSNEPTGDVDG